MGRLSFSFGKFEDPQLAWFKVPFPYGNWQYTEGQWKHQLDSSVPKFTIGKQWRVFRNVPLAPVVEQADSFQPDTAQASYFRAILPGARAHFTIRFWNLEEHELQRFVWCLILEPHLAHKMGKNRHLGFGSLRLQILPESFLIDWANRYSSLGEAEQAWRLPIQVEDWINYKAIEYYPELRKALNAQRI